MGGWLEERVSGSDMRVDLMPTVAAVVVTRFDIEGAQLENVV
jgi:hypothetical protein